MANQFYKITKEAGNTYYAEVPEGKKFSDSRLNRQLGIWYENIVGGKYRGRGIEASKVKEVPAIGVNWLSFHSTCLENKTIPKKRKQLASNE